MLHTEKPEKRAMNITILASQWPEAPTGGGIARPTAALSRALLAAGHTVHLILARNYAKPPQSLTELGPGFSWQIVNPKRDGKVDPWYLEDQWRICEEIKTSAPDVVIAQEWQGLAAVYASLGNRAPIISWLHGGTLYDLHGNETYFKDPYHAIDAGLEAAQIESSDLVISPSSFLLNLYQSTYDIQIQNSTVIPYHFPEGFERLSSQSGRPNLVFVGRLSRRKGFDRFLELCRLASKAKGEISCLIAGESVDFDGHSEVRKLRKSGIQADYLGLLPTKSLWRKVAERNSVLCVPSRLDNSPNIVYEAIASNVPIVIDGSANGAKELARYSDLVVPYSNVEEINWDSVLETPQVVPEVAVDSFNESITSEWLRNLKTLGNSPENGSISELQLEMSTGSVSVVIPTKNREQFLSRALTSVIRQDSAVSEVIVVDDCSDYDYVTSLSKQTWPFQLRAIRNTSSLGPGACRNIGASHATSEFVAFLDDDNELDSVHISESLKVINSGADYAISCLAASSEPKQKSTFTIVFLGSAGFPLSFFDNLVGDSHFLCRKSDFLLSGGFPEGREFAGEDFSYLAKAAGAGTKMRIIGQTTVRYRINSDGVENSLNATFPSLLKRDLAAGFLKMPLLPARLLVGSSSSRFTGNLHQRPWPVRFATKVLSRSPRLYAQVAKIYRRIRIA